MGNGKMYRKKRIEYLMVTFCVFISSFVMYGCVGTLNPIFESKVKGFLFVGFMAGLMLSMIVSSIILAVRFFAKRSMTFRIVAALFWFITFFAVVFVGMFIYIPYQIYNVVRIFVDKPEER